MSQNRIRKEDVNDTDFLDAYELRSDGYGLNSIYLSTTCVSTTAVTKTVVVNLASDGEGLLDSFDHPVQSGDIVWIFGTSGGSGDGYFTVDSVLDDVTFTINESFGNSTGGNVRYHHPSGSLKIGFDPRNTSNVKHNNVQQAIEDLDFAIGGGSGLTSTVHPTLRQLIHLADGVGGPFEGFLSGAYREVVGPQLAPTKITWYTNSSKTAKIVEKSITYNSIFTPTVIQWQSYNTDGVTVLAIVTDTITNNVLFESSRVRNIVDYGGGGGFLDANSHKPLRQLIHLADGIGGPFEGFASGAYREVTYPINSPFENKIVWYTDNTKTSKIVEKSIVRNSINMPTAITWKAYDVDGVTVLSTVIDSIIYSNNIFETSRTRTII